MSASVRFNPAESRFGVFSLSPSHHCPFSALLEGTNGCRDSGQPLSYTLLPTITQERDGDIPVLSCRAGKQKANGEGPSQA